MGLAVGYKEKGKLNTFFSNSYSTFNAFRSNLVYAALDHTMYLLFTKPPFERWTEEEEEYWESHGDEDLKILLNHSDCDGKLTPKECKKIYTAFTKIDTNRISNWAIPLFEKWKEAMLYCAEHNLTAYFY